MKNIKNFSSFLGGVLTVLLVAGCLNTALAASGKVSYNFSNVALGGETKITAGQDITAANGQKVPGTILFTDAAGGKTNYLPIRAVSDLLGVEIGYDSATKTVLLGKQPAAPASSASAFTAAEMASALRGDAALIRSRGGTLLPDNEPSSYTGINDKVYKVFLDRNGQKRVEYFVGNPNTLHASDAGLLGDLMESGDYRRNSKGESYGHLTLSDYVGYDPALVYLAEYPQEDRPAGYFRASEREAVPNLPKDQCPHNFTIPLYDSEGTVIGEYKVACRGHDDMSGMTIEDAKAALEQQQN